MGFFRRLFGGNGPSPEPEFAGKRVYRRPPRPQEGIVCPFCMARFQVWELEFRSISVDEEGSNGYPTAIDEKYVTFWENVHRPTQVPEQSFVLNVSDMENVTEVYFWDKNEKPIPNTPANQALIEKKSIWKVRDKFGNVTSQRICPFCHNNLPPEIGQCPNYVISMMGNTYSGKTVYLSRLLLSLLNDGFLPGYGLSIDVNYTDPNAPKNRPAVKASLRKMFTGKTSDSKDKETGKLAAATRITYMCPIIIKLQKGLETILVTLFDFPGEAIWRLRQGEEPFFQTLMNRINENTSGWLFTLDSTTLESVRRFAVQNEDEDYLQDTDDPTLNADPESVLYEFTQIFGEGNQIKAPVALVFSKADMIARYAQEMREEGYRIDPGRPFLRSSPNSNRSKVDLDNLWECEQTLREFLDGDQVLKTAQNLCSQYAWFAASATGVPVKSGQMGSESSPALRVVEPLEWLLWMLGAYAGEYSQGNRLWNVLALDARRG